MSPDFDYAEACMPDRWRVLGRPLLPFSVGHSLLLERIQSPFAIGGTLSLKDLILAVWLCERDFEVGQKSLFDGNSLRLRLFSFGVCLRASIFKSLLEVQAQSFSNYLQSALRKPKGVRIDCEAGYTYAPSILVTIRDLANHYGYSFIEIMRLPMRRATFERYAILEKDKTVTWPEPWEKGAK